MLLSATAALLFVPILWLLGSMAQVAVTTLVGELRIASEVRRIRRAGGPAPW